jgi:hypothetical protein
MGREKRIAESRSKETTDKKQPSGARLESAPAGPAPSMALPEAHGHTSTAKAIVEILALYLVPVGVIILLGKFVFRL